MARNAHRHTLTAAAALVAFTFVIAACTTPTAAVPAPDPVSSSSAGTGTPSAAPAPTGPATPDDRPNFVLILTDDQTATDLRWMPRTRNLIGDAGTRFAQGLAPHPQCCPARAMLLSGQYGHNNGVHGNFGEHGGFQAMDPDHTLATALDDAGYATAMVGKFLNGWGEADGVQPGWDIFNPTSRGVYHYYDFTMFNHGNPRHYPRAYNPDVVGKLTARYVRRFAVADAPFFIWSSQVAPHNGGGNRLAVPARRHRDDLRDVIAPSLSAASFNQADGPDRPAWTARHDAFPAAKVQRKFTRRIQSLQAVDSATARVVAALRDTGELDNTYLVFVSDNGYLLGEHRLTGKNVPYEEALRIPFLVRGPGVRAGTVSQVPVGLLDLAPTFLAAAGATSAEPMDGVDLLPLLHDGAAPDRDTLLLQGGAGQGNRDQDGWLFRGVRTDRYTYAEWPDTGDVELYDRSGDPDQMVNLADNPAHQVVRADLAARLAVLGECAGATCRTRFGTPPVPTS